MFEIQTNIENHEGFTKSDLFIDSTFNHMFNQFILQDLLKQSIRFGYVTPKLYQQWFHCESAPRLAHPINHPTQIGNALNSSAL